MKALDQAVAELKLHPERPVILEVDDLILEVRCKGRRSANDIFEAVGPWEGEAAEELMALIQAKASQTISDNHETN